MLEFRSLHPIYPIHLYKPQLLTHIRSKLPRPLLCKQHQTPQHRVVVEFPLIFAQLESASRMLERACCLKTVPPLQSPPLVSSRKNSRHWDSSKKTFLEISNLVLRANIQFNISSGVFHEYVSLMVEAAVEDLVRAH